MQKIIEKLQNLGSNEDRLELAVAFSGHKKAMQVFKDSPGEKSRRDLQAAKEHFEGVYARQVEKYLPELAAKNQETEVIRRFASKKEVLDYLQSDGKWQISSSQFYAHAKQGLLRPDKDGRYQLKAVEKYARTWLKEMATGQKVNERRDKIQEETLEKELRAANIKLEREQFEFDLRKGRFIPRDQFELAIVGRAVAFLAHLNHTVQTNAADWIDIVGGDQARAPELVQAISREIEQRMGDFAADAEIDVILEAN